ncbi:hypothetical protein [Streptomyces sp. NPDC002845]
MFLRPRVGRRRHDGAAARTDGLKPATDAPVRKMSFFRDRFLTAYGSTPHPSEG